MGWQLLIKVPEKGYVVIKAAEILYIEIQDRRCRIHTVKDEFCTYKTIKALCKELPDFCFYQSHRAFIVNMNYIEGWNQTEICMRDGRMIPLSHKRKAEFRRIYMSFCEKQQIGISQVCQS